MKDVCSFAGRPALVADGAAGSLKFGLPVLRGLVHDLTGHSSCACVLAGIRCIMAAKGFANQILVGRDLRLSSPVIAPYCAAAVDFAGATAMDHGEVPRSALALVGQRRNRPDITGTGNHIPDDRNGLKPSIHDGQITKEDEATMVQDYGRLSNDSLASLAATPPRFAAPEDYPLGFNMKRYVRFFGLRALRRPKVVGRQHSSVARNVLADTGLVTNVSHLDGLHLCAGSTAHCRAPASASELRCHVEAEGKECGEKLLARGLQVATSALQQMKHGPI